MQYLLSRELVDHIDLHTKALVARTIDQGVDPQLAVVLVGQNEASVRYVGIKSRQAKQNGIILSLYHMDEDTSFDVIQEAVRFLDADPDVHGVIIQLPLPDHITSEQTERLIHTVSEQKDVDGLRGDWQRLSHTRHDLPTLLEQPSLPLPPMVLSVMGLLDWYQIPIEGQNIVLVGEGRLVGGPLRTYLQALGQKVSVVTEETEHIFSITRQADILISGTGEDNLVTHEWIKEGAVVIDCAADIHTDSVEQVASTLAPSKGGVGPLTVAWLLHNLAQAANLSVEVPRVN